ncbi:uncharacterized protein Dvir_GJ26301 [Drosophila virilis]|uniref:Uncharacterized protein n=1 Tax=Drosophila virilis TaxID=7244 RepID=A0A0Q9WVL7_DROVI|nr:uncharacterized protein LOC26531071 [Drosophila virilis]KRF85012.1 uncharacterized protein Dvir_GJ26301 [Drosophila virilis]
MRERESKRTYSQAQRVTEKVHEISQQQQQQQQSSSSSRRDFEDVGICVEPAAARRRCDCDCDGDGDVHLQQSAISNNVKLRATTTTTTIQIKKWVSGGNNKSKTVISHLAIVQLAVL